MNWHIGQFGRVQVNLLVEPRILYFGVFRSHRYWETGTLWLPLYISPIPMLALLLTIECRPRREDDEGA